MKMSQLSKSNHRREQDGQRARRRVRPANTREKGQALVELAVLLMPVLLLLTVGIIDYGQVAYYSIEVSDAARAGAQYGSQSLADAANTADIRTAAQQSAQDIGAGQLNVNVPPPSCVCPGSGQVTGVDCTGPLGCYPLVYLTVTTAYTLSTPISFPGIPATFNLTGTSTLPVQVQ